MFANTVAMLALSFTCNEDAAMVYECVRDCGKHGVRVVVSSDADSEGIYCECADMFDYIDVEK